MASLFSHVHEVLKRFVQNLPQRPTKGDNLVPKLVITVLRRDFNKDLADKYVGGPPVACERFKDGQQFTVDSFNQPEGFCYWAWHDIFPFVSVLMRGGDFTPWMKEKDTLIACCTDGIRPVIFELKRVE